MTQFLDIPDANEVSAKDMELRKRIMDKAQEIFFQFGFSRVTMDELASELGMSKKTLYKYFSSKEDIVRAIVRNVCSTMECEIDRFMAEPNTNFVQKLDNILGFVHKTVGRVNPTMAQDVRRFIPELWNEMEEFRRNHTQGSVSKLFKLGKKEGIFRADINEDIAVMIYSQAANTIINPALLAETPFNVSDVYRTFVRIFFEGFLTEKGRTEIETIKQKNKSKK